MPECSGVLYQVTGCSCIMCTVYSREIFVLVKPAPAAQAAPTPGYWCSA